jgi:hypothetical protein
MSSKSSIILTDCNEHWYNDCSEYIESKDGSEKQLITMEFSKSNIRIDLNDNEDLVISIINPDCEIYKIISNLK